MVAPTIGSLSSTDAPPTAGGGAGSGAGSPGNAPTGSVLDLFAQLKEFQWKGVGVPVVETGFDLRQDLVVHKYADRNGAFVEGVGRHPMEITALIPFLNTIYSAKSETWAQGALYPYQLRLFLRACMDGTSGTLQHPEFGPLNCKVELVHGDWKSTVTQGIWVHAKWVESDDTQADQLGQDLSAASPVGDLVASADDLDDQIAQFVGAYPGAFPPMQYSFDSLVSAVVGVIDTPSLLAQEYQGRVANIVAQANRVEDALGSVGAASPLNWPMFQNCERLKASAYALAAQPAVAQKRPTGTITIQKDSTLAQLIAQTNSDAGDFIQLNYRLVGQPVVPTGTVVQFYLAAA